MIAQDTGSAIVGPARADLYLGAGDDAARIAGRIRHPGRFVMLLPRELDMIAAGKHMPLPVPKPNVPELAELNKQEQGKREPQPRQQQVFERRKPQQKQQPLATEARRPQDKQSPHAMELRGEQKQPGPATDARRG
jgi:peptidoglycan lytic transglycosylase A